jgi:CheY-like chemotaxis protein
MKTAALESVVPTTSTVGPRFLNSLAAPAFNGSQVAARNAWPSALERTRIRTLLLVSSDAALASGLELVAASRWLSVAQTAMLGEAVEQAQSGPLAAILVDLDLPMEAGWQAAEWFLRPGVRVPALMLTGQADHYDLEPAIQAGTLLAKTYEPAGLLRSLDALLAESVPQGQARLAQQRAWLRWAKPYRSGPVAGPAHFRWGINE